MAKIATTPIEGRYTLIIDDPMLGMLHDVMKFVEGRGKPEFRTYIANIYEGQEVSETLIDQYTSEFHKLIHEGMMKRAGIIPNE